MDKLRPSDRMTHLDPPSNALMVVVVFVNLSHFILITDFCGLQLFDHTTEAILQIANFLCLEQDLSFKVLTVNVNKVLILQELPVILLNPNVFLLGYYISAKDFSCIRFKKKKKRL